MPLRMMAFAALLYLVVSCSGVNPAVAEDRADSLRPFHSSGTLFGDLDPAGRSLRSTQELGNQFREQQHRFQPNADRRQLRTRRPEPGETEVNREGEMRLPNIDKGARTLKGEIAPETPRRPPYHPPPLRVPGGASTGQ